MYACHYFEELMNNTVCCYYIQIFRHHYGMLFCNVSHTDSDLIYIHNVHAMHTHANVLNINATIF